jgi:phosphoribosyl-ATP pyrophosphohydrolase/phosphoribosyl-AMP cyclohydrolase/histidinol dehydrogenase
MTAIPARIAGVEKIIVATPKPSPDMIAAAYIADADCILTIGGAQAIAGMVYGTGDIPRCDLIVGPGNRWVSAAKQLLYGQVAIDMIAGPSELVVFADDSASPEMIAIDLLAQAEHDTDALPVLISLSSELIDDVRNDLNRLLDEYPSETAERSLANGFAVKVSSIDEGVELCNRIAPEHLELNLKDAAKIAPKLKHYGALFIGQQTAEVFGDYGAGPNHVLPTSGTARFASGLSVMTFLRQATWLELDNSDDDSAVARDAADFARLEGLYWHSRAAQVRMNRY